MFFKIKSDRFTRRLLRDLKRTDLEKEDFAEILNAIGRKMNLYIYYESANHLDERMFRGIPSPSRFVN